MATNLKTAKKVEASLREQACSEKAALLPQFFQAYPGGYGEGDRFLGVIVPDQRAIAKQFRELPASELDKLLASTWHECRLTALMILVDQYQRGPEAQRAAVFRFYLDHLDAVNNWDLVDSSAAQIVGQHLVAWPREKPLLTQLAKTDHLWRQRVAMVSTHAMIRAGNYQPTQRLARTFLSHPHDLIHKASGWMLREMGKRDEGELINFLDQHGPRMPRTMLRYALERLPEEVRKRYMQIPILRCAKPSRTL